MYIDGLGQLDFDGQAFVDWMCPVNWLDPLARGLAGLWLPVLGAVGGQRLTDLTQRNDGTLTNMDPPTDWLSASRSYPGGWGALDFDGTDDYVRFPVPPHGLPAIDGPKSVSMWLQYDGTATRRILLAMVLDDTGAADNSLDLSINDGGGGLVVVVGSQWGGAQMVQAFLDPTNANIGADTWFFFTYTAESAWGNQKIYLNGRDWTFNPTASSQVGATGVLRIASFNSAFPSPYHNRPIGLVAIHNRPLTLLEHQDFYLRSRLGLPGLLNRLPRAWALDFDVIGGHPSMRRLSLSVKRPVELGRHRTVVI